MEFVLDEIYRVLSPEGEILPNRQQGMSDELALSLFRHMILTRLLDERLTAIQRQGRIGFHIGSMGEEASILGSTAALRSNDWLFPCYREFGALLWRGMPLKNYIDNMFGNANDPAKGRQMPDHYSGKPYKFGSVSSPIGTQITQAVGFAWAAKNRKDPLVTLTYFGDGATSSSEFHNGANFAGVFRTPTVLFCRNNGWAISVPTERQTASATFAQKAFAYGIRPVRVDGTDLFAVYQVTREAIEQISNGGPPVLIEALSHRLSGHSTSDDPRVYRTEAEMEAERKTDPITRLRSYFTARNLWSDAQHEALRTELDQEIKQCIDLSSKVPAPALRTMFEDVYQTMPEHLKTQWAECEAAPRAAGHGSPGH